MVDVLLIEPPPKSAFGNLRTLGSMGTCKADFAWPPLDLMIISGLLKKHGVSCKIYDANTLRASFDELRDVIKEAAPRCVVFTTSTPTIYHDVKVAEVAKSVSPDITTIAVGTHITARHSETLNESEHLDIAVYSESELPILDLVKADYDPRPVQGIAYKDEEGDVHRNPPHPVCQNLDDFGFPTHDELPLDMYRDPLMKRAPMTVTYGTRGCINACIYCSSPFYNNFRKRTVEHVMSELRHIVDIGVKEVRFFDCGLTNDYSWCVQLMDGIINEKLDISWVCNSRADKLSEELIKRMKKAGCHSISVGAESANIEILKNIKKNITPDMVEKAVKMAKAEGVQVLVYFMLGLPGETRETIKETVDFAKRLKPDIITLGIATPHPGTEFYDILDRNGYLTTNDWSMFDPGGRPVYNYAHLAGQEIHDAMVRGYRSYYLRPSYILRRLKSLKSALDVKNNFNNFTGFIRRYVFQRDG